MKISFRQRLYSMIDLRRRPLIVWAVLQGLLLLVFGTYVIAAIRGYASITVPIFFGMLFTLAVVNGIMLFAAWRTRDHISPLMKVALIIWGGVASWYWTFAPLYYVLNMNLNETQLAWTAFAFLWEVPVIGGGILITLGVMLFRPILRAVESDSAQTDSLAAYRQAVRYPWRIALLLFILSIMGYMIGTWQIWQFAGLSNFEIVKSISNGPIVAIFLAAVFYVILDTHMDQYRRKLSRWLLSRPSQFRSLRQRLTIVNMAVLVGSVGLLGLLVVQSWQSLQEQRLEEVLYEDLAKLKTMEITDDRFFGVPAHGRRGFVLNLPEAELESLVISKETLDAMRQPEGVVRDLRNEGKMIGFVQRDNSYVLSVTYLTDIYDFVQPGVLASYGSGAILVIVITLAMFLFVSYEITGSLISLKKFANKPSVAKWGKLVGVHTGDEIESVGREFLHYVQKADEIDKTQREFVSIASHQLRTPLTAIQWYVELLQSERDGRLNENQRNDLQRIARGSKRMVQLVNSLLNISRIDSGRLAIRPEKTEIVAFLRQLVDDIMPQIKHKECEIEVKQETDKLDVRVDRLLLQQVVHNLLTNAIKYRDSKRLCSITVRLKQQENSDVLIVVSDTGVGIPAKEQYRVFEKFWRADNVSTLDTEGTGLGLYVSKMLLEASGASISFKSHEGVGTTFQITIPARGMLAKPGEVDLSNIDNIK